MPDTKKLGAACALFDADGRVLLVKHSYGPLNWELPGGGALPGESPVQTAVREVREETGLSVEALATSGVYFDPETDWLHFVFVCRESDGSEPFAASAEITQCGFFAPDALPSPISDFSVRRIRDAAGRRPAPLPVTVGPRVWL